MAAAWIKMRINLADDPAVILIAELLGLDEFAVVGRLQHLWSWADSQSRDGHARGVTGKWIDRYVRCDGFAQAMVEAGWLCIDGAGVSIPNFERHNGETAKSRGLATNRQQRKRGAGHDPVTPESPEPSRTSRDKSVTREEKIKSSLSTAGDREEIAGGAFAMSLEWEPDQKRLKAFALRAGLAMDLFTTEGIAQFVIHRAAGALAKTEDEWLSDLVAWRLRDKQSGAARGNVTPLRSSQPEPSGDWASQGVTL